MIHALKWVAIAILSICLQEQAQTITELQTKLKLKRKSGK